MYEDGASLNFDLIHGLPLQTKSTITKTMELVKKLKNKIG